MRWKEVPVGSEPFDMWVQEAELESTEGFIKMMYQQEGKMLFGEDYKWTGEVSFDEVLDMATIGLGNKKERCAMIMNGDKQIKQYKRYGRQ